jgi:hypothetical protein
VSAAAAASAHYDATNLYFYAVLLAVVPMDFLLGPESVAVQLVVLPLLIQIRCFDCAAHRLFRPFPFSMAEGQARSIDKHSNHSHADKRGQKGVS